MNWTIQTFILSKSKTTFFALMKLFFFYRNRLKAAEFFLRWILILLSHYSSRSLSLSFFPFFLSLSRTLLTIVTGFNEKWHKSHRFFSGYSCLFDRLNYRADEEFGRFFVRCFSFQILSQTLLAIDVKLCTIFNSNHWFKVLSTWKKFDRSLENEYSRRKKSQNEAKPLTDKVVAWKLIYSERFS